MEASLLYPPFGLELRTPRLTLRAVDDAALADLASVNIDDIFTDPTCAWAFPWSKYPKPDIARRTAAFHWGLRVSNTPDNWQIPLAAYSDGVFVGSIDLRATNFAKDRTISTGSYVLKRWQRQGFGRLMRQMALNYGFGSLGAETMRSSWHPDNVASAQVSRALGYVEVGTGTEDGGPVVIAEIPRSQWRRTDMQVRGHTEQLERFLGV